MILVGLGSNLSSSFGDRFDNINKAISLFLDHDIQLVKKSSFYETPSYPNKKKPKFINLVIQAKTVLTPKMLAFTILKVEKKLEKNQDKNRNIFLQKFTQTGNSDLICIICEPSSFK